MKAGRKAIYFRSHDDRWLAPYQHYYRLGLQSQGLELVPVGAPAMARLRFLDRFSGPRKMFRAFGDAVSPFVGQYILDDPEGGTRTRFAIDAHDKGEIYSREILEWSDVYFKSNRWPARTYPSKVRPVVNGNGSLGEADVLALKTMRETLKTHDVVFISRVWGGREHNIRLFERLARVKGGNVLHAIFTREERGLDATRAYIRRLETAGVSHGFDAVPREELWEALAGARVVFIRAGKHRCIPWRMIDLLAMGACIVTDGVPKPNWPVPLVEGVHYLSAGVERPEGSRLAPPASYDRVTDCVRGILADPGRRDRLRRAGADYFDRHAAPARVGAMLLEGLGGTPGETPR